MKSLSLAVMSMWNCVQGADVTYTCKQLQLKPNIVMTFYKLARRIMAWDAERRQSEFVFGCLPDGQTCDVEADEACFFSYSEEDDLNRYFDDDGELLSPPMLGQAATQAPVKTHHFYVWLGVYQRGTQKLWLKELGLKRSEGHGRLPPLSPDLWAEVCLAIFRSDANIVLMSDSALAYTLRPLPNGIVDAHHVNHSRKPVPELSRSCEVLGNVATGDPRAAVCSTNLIDPTWRTIKTEIPDRGNVSARTPKQRRHMAEYIRTGQWR